MKKIFVALFVCLVGIFAAPAAHATYDSSSAYDCDNGGDFPMRFGGCKPGYYYEDWQSADDSLGPEDVGECLECPSDYNCAGGFAGPVGSPCSTGYYGTTAESCSACTNKPAHSTYTGAAETNTCPWMCDSGYGESNGSCVACSAGDIWVNGTCQTTKFSITTTNLSANTKFAFVMTAAGTFYVDWGDGTQETISRTNNTPAKYSHTYATGGVKTIRFGGTATGYADPDRYEQPPAIAFATYVPIYDYDTDEDYTYYELGAEFIASVSGNMSAVFPWISGNSATGAQPRFYATFEGATNLSSIDGNLFANYTTGSTSMFYGTFYGCTSLESIPAGLFSGITTGANSMFSSTFQACTSLQSIPAGLFSSITTGAIYMFYQTFYNCTSLQSIPAGLFGNITTGADSMFGYTFYKCTSLQSIPAELFSGITTGAVSMFSNTFYGCTSLESIPAGLFSNITTGASNMFQLTFANCTNLSGYIPPTTFKKGMGSYSGMWSYTFTGTQLAISCPSGTTQYITGYEGGNINTTWNGKVSCTCATGTYYNGTACVASTFSVTTTALSANDTFSFSLSATGTFYVNWGDGYEQTITRTDTTATTYSHTYTDADAYTISFGGVASGYATNISRAAISFYNLGAAKISSVSGNMSAMFPYITANAQNGAQPRFYQTFKGAINLSSIPGTLFTNYTTGAYNMFYGTFNGCTGLTGTNAIPANLFSNITTGAQNLFAETFSNCTSLESIPANLFSSITTSANYMFNGTFLNCTSLQSIPAGLFGNITTGAYSMFYQTFKGCTSLQSIPAGLFGNITTGANYMFNSTFSGCTGLTGANAIPENLFFSNATSVTGQEMMFYNTFYGCTGLTGIPAGLFSKITTSGYGMFSYTFYGCTGLTSIPENLFFPNATSVTGQTAMFESVFRECTGLNAIPAGLFSKITTAAENMFSYTFSGCTNLSGYIPPSTFAGLVANNHPNAQDMWQNTFANTQLVTSCPSSTYKYTTGYESPSSGGGQSVPGGLIIGAGNSIGDWNGKVSCEACPTGYTSAAGATAQNQCYITVSGGHYIGTAGQNSTNWGTCAAGYAKAEHTVNYGSTSSCDACITDQTTGRPAYSGAGAASCSVCPAISDALAPRLNSYAYWYTDNIHSTIDGCYVTLHDDDPTGTYYFACYYREADGTYGGPNSPCDIYTPYISACAAGYGNAISSGAGGYGVDFIKGQVCTPCSAGTYSADGSLTCSAISGGYYNTGCGTNATGGVCDANYTGGTITAGYFSSGGGKSPTPTSNDCTSGNTCGQCTTDPTTGRPAYTDAAGGASSCSVCPAVTGDLASRATGEYGYYPDVHGSGVGNCYTYFSDSDDTATFSGLICYHGSGDYGDANSRCQVYVPSLCAAGYGSIIENQPEWNGSYAGTYGVDSMNGRVCGACPAGTYSTGNTWVCVACSTLGGGLYTSSAGGGDASSCYVSTTAGYYLADKDNSSQTICPAVNYCPSATLYWPNANTPTACPTADSSTARTTYPDNYYNPTMTRISNQNWSTGLSSINSCQANYNFTNGRGVFTVESVQYNSSTGKYDTAGYKYYNSINPGYYGMTRLNDDYCANGGSLMYYQNAEPCPAGSYCPGLSSMPSCSSGTYNETIGINACTGATYSGNGAASCTACPTGYNYNTTNGKSSVTQCQTNCAAGQWISAPGTLLPNGYTRIEYLESTGTQYIDTGVKLTSNDVIYEWNAKDNDNGDYATSLFGAEYDTGVDHNGDNRLFSGVLYSTCRSRGLWLGAIHSAYMAYDSCDNEFHAWQLAVNSNHTVSLTKDGVQTAQISWSDELNKANNIFIYANNTTGYAGQFSNVAYKYFKITDNGRLVFDGVPARRNSDNALGMYDMVSGNFFTNAGSGTFIAGPDVTSGTGQCATVDAGYAATGGVADFGSTIARTQCTGATYSGTGASSCTACPTVTGAYASRAIGNYGYNGGYSVHTTPEQCWATFNDDDAAGTYYFACYYNATDGGYGGANSFCDIYPEYISGCAAGAYKTLESASEWQQGRAYCYGMDCIKGKVCSNVGAGYYSADGDLTRTACPTGLYTVGYGHGADEANDCGHVLHVGNYEIYARQDKATTPSINIKMPDNNIYYVSLSPSNHNISPLHVSYEGSQYTAYDDSLMYGERSFN